MLLKYIPYRNEENNLNWHKSCHILCHKHKISLIMTLFVKYHKCNSYKKRETMAFQNLICQYMLFLCMQQKNAGEGRYPQENSMTRCFSMNCRIIASSSWLFVFGKIKIWALHLSSNASFFLGRLENRSFRKFLIPMETEQENLWRCIEHIWTNAGQE